ncbi:MAG: SDR family oxidoreductase [Chitinophagaceae bacterium]|nr:MAG: SDR family oxidoreductase [Chitinophagaceae bacterium]
MEITLQGKTAVVCGSTQGIGLAIADAFAAAGAACILVARSEDKLQSVVEKLQVHANAKHCYYVADFQDSHAVASIAAEIANTSDVHILVNNTGGPKPGPIAGAVTSEFATAFEQHVINNQILAQAFLPGMQKNKYGRIINIVSTSVKQPLSNLGVSNTIRAAVAGWAKTWSNEVGQYNVTVNNILPGLTQTSRLSSLVETMSKNSGVSVDEVVTGLQKEIPLRRFGEPSELAALALFLASPLASYITGTSIAVDGGRTATLA